MKANEQGRSPPEAEEPGAATPPTAGQEGADPQSLLAELLLSSSVVDQVFWSTKSPEKQEPPAPSPILLPAPAPEPVIEVPVELPDKVAESPFILPPVDAVPLPPVQPEILITLVPEVPEVPVPANGASRAAVPANLPAPGSAWDLLSADQLFAYARRLVREAEQEPPPPAVRRDWRFTVPIWTLLACVLVAIVVVLVMALPDEPEGRRSSAWRPRPRNAARPFQAQASAVPEPLSSSSPLLASSIFEKIFLQAPPVKPSRLPARLEKGVTQGRSDPFVRDAAGLRKLQQAPASLYNFTPATAAPLGQEGEALPEAGQLRLAAVLAGRHTLALVTGTRGGKPFKAWVKEGEQLLDEYRVERIGMEELQLRSPCHAAVLNFGQTTTLNRCQA